MSTVLRPQNFSRPAAQTERGTFAIQTWGCQMNEEDSEQLALSLQKIGFTASTDVRNAHVVLLNTCSVRKKPEDKAFSLLGELALIKQNRPEMVIGVCGCMAQARADEIRRRAPHVDFVLGTGDISQVGALVEEALQGRKFQKRVLLPERKGAVVTDIPARITERYPKLKAFVPIQYGCDKFCSFCIVPATRGRERSRPTEEILEEVRNLAASGTKEVTLLGQTVNSYGKNLLEGRVPFSELLRLVADVPGIERIRYMSPYPRDFKSDLIDVIRDVPQVMPHLHMPLQAGCDELLKAMKRQYTRESFAAILAEVREKVPDCLVTTDVIVGFPGETEEQFERTLDAIREFRFYGAYMFIYSPRPDTPAADMEQLPYRLKQERLTRLVDLQHGIAGEWNRSFVGREMEVLVEGASPKDKGKLQGYAQQFVMCHFPGDLEKYRGEIVTVRVTDGFLWGCQAEIV